MNLFRVRIVWQPTAKDLTISDSHYKYTATEIANFCMRTKAYRLNRFSMIILSIYKSCQKMMFQYTLGFT